MRREIALIMFFSQNRGGAGGLQFVICGGEYTEIFQDREPQAVLG